MPARPSYIVAVSDGDIYMGYDPVQLTLAENGANALEDTPDMGMQDGPGSPNDAGDTAIHRHMYFCDGTNYKRLDAHTGEVSNWEAFNGTDAVTGDEIAGELPKDADDNVATIMALYRGRIVLSGVLNDPHNWFMSAVEDPRNWDYSPPTITETMAVAGNASPIGRVADAVTALAPFSDDLLIIGGDKSIWLMRGDPAAGGTIDNISQKIGIVGKDAWAFDPSNNFYFFGNDGLYRAAPTGEGMERVSAGKLDRTFAEVDRREHRVLLEWDRERKGLYIFITGDDPEAEHALSYWYDQRTDAFWPIRLPHSNGPTSVMTWDSDLANDRAVLLGGRDGFIRGFRNFRPNDNDGVDDE